MLMPVPDAAILARKAMLVERLQAALPAGSVDLGPERNPRL